MAQAQLGELDIHYVERGSGPALLLVPGIPAIASDWARWPSGSAARAA